MYKPFLLVSFFVFLSVNAMEEDYLCNLLEGPVLDDTDLLRALALLEGEASQLDELEKQQQRQKDVGMRAALIDLTKSLQTNDLNSQSYNLPLEEEIKNSTRKRKPSASKKSKSRKRHAPLYFSLVFNEKDPQRFAVQCARAWESLKGFDTKKALDQWKGEKQVTQAFSHIRLNKRDEKEV